MSRITRTKARCYDSGLESTSWFLDFRRTRQGFVGGSFKLDRLVAVRHDASSADSVRTELVLGPQKGTRLGIGGPTWRPQFA